jgi:hypothetical protein
MANTTNFNWETPDDTDLVKDGAAAIRTLGNSIDTSFVDLKGGTTGQILSKASNTDLDYTWIANDQGDITEVQAGTGISVASGTGPIPVVTNTVATTFDAKGDLVVGTGADTFAKLTVGTNGYTLVADSSVSPTGLKWAVDPVADVVTTAGDLLYATAADTVTRLGIGTAGQVLKVNSGATAPEWGAAPAASFVGCSLYNSAVQSITQNTLTTATFDSENFDTNGFHSTSSNTGRITIPVGLGGKYLFLFNLKFAASASATARVAYLKKNGGSNVDFIFQTGQNAPALWSRSAILNLAENDYIEMQVYQETSGALNYEGTSGIIEAFACEYLGA